MSDSETFEKLAEKTELHATDSSLAESLFELSYSAESLDESVTVPDFQAQLVSCRLKPKPNATVEEVGLSQVLNEPSVLVGQMSSFFFVIAIGAALWQNQLFSIGVMAFITPIVLTVVVLALAVVLVKMKMRLGLELLGGLIYPFSFLDRAYLRTLSFELLGEGMQSRNKYLQASVCFAHLLRICDPLDVVEKRQLRERNYLYSLVYADKIGEALAYADRIVEFAEYLVSTADRPVTSNYFAFATRLAGQIYELAGESEKANLLQERCYQNSLRAPQQSASGVYGLLAKAEELFSREKYTEASGYFQQFFAASRHCDDVRQSTIYMSKAYLNQAVSLAHSGKIDEGYKVFEEGKKCLRDLATFANAELEFTEAELCILSGERERAVEILEKVRRTLELQNCSFLDRRQRQLLRQNANFRTYEPPLEEGCFSKEAPGVSPEYMLADETGEFRSGLIRLFALAAVMACFLANTSIKNLPALLMLVLLMAGILGFCLNLYLQSKKKVRWAEIALHRGIPCLVKVKFPGESNDVSINFDGKSEVFTFGNSQLKEQIQKILGDSEFDAVAFRTRGNAGNLAALQVFGQTASIAKKKNWILPR